jgi:hypothetical protein
MADMQRVHNTRLSSYVVSQAGRRVLGCTTDTIDVSEPRAVKGLTAGILILVDAPAAPVRDEGGKFTAVETPADEAEPVTAETAQVVETARTTTTKKGK